MQEVHLTSGIPFCFYRYPFWVSDIHFCFVKELTVGSVQFQSTPVEIYNTKCVFQETSKGLHKIPVRFYVKPTKSKMKF